MLTVTPARIPHLQMSPVSLFSLFSLFHLTFYNHHDFLKFNLSAIEGFILLLLSSILDPFVTSALLLPRMGGWFAILLH